jgi:hypothetical protein
MAEIQGIFHKFISAVPDDPTIPQAVRPQVNWNDIHIFQGGDQGQVLSINEASSSRLSALPILTAIGGRLINVQVTQQNYIGSVPSGSLALQTYVPPPSLAPTPVILLIVYRFAMFDQGPTVDRFNFLAVAEVPNVPATTTVVGQTGGINNMWVSVLTAGATQRIWGVFATTGAQGANTITSGQVSIATLAFSYTAG